MLGLVSCNGHIEVNSSLRDAILHDRPELKEDEWGAGFRFSIRRSPSQP
jgi:hypothetical protein